MMARLRLAVAGAGLIGRRHIEAIAACPDAVLVAIADPTPEAKALSEKLGVSWYEDPETLVAECKPDGLILATPNALHTPQALAAIAAGVPLIVEKPLAATSQDAWAIVEAGEKAGVPVAAGHHRRHNPLIAAAKDAIASGEIGRLVALNAITWFFKPDHYFDTAWRREPGGGPLLINMIHDCDLFLHLAGPVSSVQAVTSNAVRGFKVEDTAAAVLTFESGAVATLTVSDTIPAPWSWELTAGENPAYPQSSEACYFLGGTKGSLALPSVTLWRHEGPDGWWSPIAASRRPIAQEDPLVRQIAQFCAVIRGEEKPLAPAREAAQAIDLLDAIIQSSRTGQPVTPGKERT